MVLGDHLAQLQRQRHARGDPFTGPAVIDVEQLPLRRHQVVAALLGDGQEVGVRLRILDQQSQPANVAQEGRRIGKALVHAAGPGQHLGQHRTREAALPARPQRLVLLERPRRKVAQGTGQRDALDALQPDDNNSVRDRVHLPLHRQQRRIGDLQHACGKNRLG